MLAINDPVTQYDLIFFYFHTLDVGPRLAVESDETDLLSFSSNVGIRSMLFLKLVFVMIR